MIKNYGFKRNEVDDVRAYTLGAIELPKTVLAPDGQWDAWTPIDELQHTPQFDTYGCTVYGTENIQQILERRIYGETKEYDERYNYNILKIIPPGCDPHDAAESFRNDGVVTGELPMTTTYEEYAKPRPMSSNLIDKGIAHPYELRHQWLWKSPISNEQRANLIKEYLKYSPLGVSVTAWKLRDGVYVDDGQSNTHWTVLYGWTNNGWKIYDSYAPNRKILSFNHNIECCKRYQLVASTRKAQLGIFGKILALVLNFLVPNPVVNAVLPVVPIQLPEEPTPETVKESKLVLWAKSIEIYEGANKAWNNPGAIRGKGGAFLKFKTYEEGFNYLLDYLKRAATGKHAAYKKGGETTLLEFQKIYSPSSDNNNPDLYAQFIAKRLKVETSEKIKNLV